MQTSEDTHEVRPALPGATHAPINHEIKHTAEKKALAFRSGHRVQQFTECLCVFVFGVCVCVPTVEEKKNASLHG